MNFAAFSYVSGHYAGCVAERVLKWVGFLFTRDDLRAARVENSVEYLCRRRILHRSHKW